MCGCGRKRTTVVTTAQVEQDEARRLMDTLETQTVSAAEAMLKSASNAVGNARS
jgi:predicted Fe-S protein YdhL (DUF1289 family)